MVFNSEMAMENTGNLVCLENDNALLLMDTVTDLSNVHAIIAHLENFVNKQEGDAANLLIDLVYDGVFEVLQWLLFLSAVPPVQLLTGWCVTAKAPPDISAISALTAVKHGNCSSLTPLLNPVRTRKSLIWP